MKLVVHEVKASELSGTWTAPKNTSVVALRPHLTRFNWPTGSLKLEVYDSEDDLLAESESIEIEDIVGPNEYDFFHGYVTFLINVGLRKDETYKFKIVAEDGYTFNDSAYVGWCNGFDLGKYPAVYTPVNSLQYPLDIEIWERKSK